MFCLPESLKVVQGLALEGAGAGANSLPVSLKTVSGKLYIMVSVYRAGGAAMVLTPQTDTLVAFGSAAGLASAVRIWANETTGTTDLLVEQTAAVAFTTTADVNPKLVIFEIDPADLTAGEDCVRLAITNVPNADSVAVIYVYEPRYASRVSTQPTAITD